MRPHGRMQAQILEAANAIRPALLEPLVDGDALVDPAELSQCTSTVAEFMARRRGPAAAVYITWDTQGRCRYVGSVRRPGAASAARERLVEHLRHDERRAAWYGVTVLPLHCDLDAVVRECEGRVARRLSPLDGTAHPVPSADQDLDEVIRASVVTVTS